MSSSKRTTLPEELRNIGEVSEEEEKKATEMVEEVLMRTEKRTAVVPVADSFTELRGVLEGTTDEEGRSGTEMLREERERDKRKDAKSTRHLKFDE